jgi:hypothetical protein
MSEQPVWSMGDELPEELARVRNAVACELHAQLAMRNETISLADVPEVAYAVAAQLRHEFRIEWTPPTPETAAGDREDRATSGI